MHKAVNRREDIDMFMNVTVIPIIVNALGANLTSLKRDWQDWKSVEKSRPYRPQLYKLRLE